MASLEEAITRSPVGRNEHEPGGVDFEYGDAGVGEQSQ